MKRKYNLYYITNPSIFIEDFSLFMVGGHEFISVTRTTDKLAAKTYSSKEAARKDKALLEQFGHLVRISD